MASVDVAVSQIRADRSKAKPNICFRSRTSGYAHNPPTTTPLSPNPLLVNAYDPATGVLVAAPNDGLDIFDEPGLCNDTGCRPIGADDGRAPRVLLSGCTTCVSICRPVVIPLYSLPSIPVMSNVESTRRRVSTVVGGGGGSLLLCCAVHACGTGARRCGCGAVAIGCGVAAAGAADDDDDDDDKNDAPALHR